MGLRRMIPPTPTGGRISLAISVRQHEQVEQGSLLKYYGPFQLMRQLAHISRPAVA